MALLPMFNYFVFNNEIKPVADFIPSENEEGIYEVVRVAKGVPLFLEDHLKRFFISAEIAGKPILFSETQLLILLQNLIEKNKAEEGNVLISCKSNLKIFFIAHKYPSKHLYQSGVKCGILKAEREKPNAKVFQTTVRQRADELITKKDFYEVILVNNLGRITEGSRSNVFFIKDNQIFTPPGNEVLLGITREKTIFLAKKLRIKLLERNLKFENINLFDAAFITGTSPKILPVCEIEGLDFDPINETVRRIIKSYNNLITEYIYTHKTA